MLFWRVALLRTHRINPNLRLTSYQTVQDEVCPLALMGQGLF
jgi:hypothetical protein